MLFAGELAPDLQSGPGPSFSKVMLESAVLRRTYNLLRDTMLAPSDGQDASPAQHGRYLGQVFEALLEYSPRVDIDQSSVLFRPSTGHDRKSTGSYYTPDSLVDHLLETTLAPVLAETTGSFAFRDANALERALLSVRICDPSAGTGHFLIAAAQRVTDAILALSHPSGGAPAEHRLAVLTRVTDSCMYGVDINPLAVELCKVSLWLACRTPKHPFTRLNAHIKTGNALLGATPSLVHEGIPDAAFHAGHDLPDRTLSKLRQRNKAERSARHQGRTTVEPKGDQWDRLLADAWCAAFVWQPRQNTETSRHPAGDSPWHHWTDRGLQALASNRADVPKSIQKQILDVARKRGFFHWSLEFPDVLPSSVNEEGDGFDVIVGNPPFLNQLETVSASDRCEAALLQHLTGGASRGYADLSATFLLRACQLCRSGGRVGLIQPQSVLAAKNASSIRRAILQIASTSHLWVSNERVFEGVNVFTCAPTLHVGGPRTTALARSVSREFRQLPTIQIDADDLRSHDTWAPLAAAALGIPECRYQSSGTIADLAAATADFRDQYYGLDGFLVQDASVTTPLASRDIHYPPLVTSGLIDLAETHWDRRSTRVLKQSWTAPRIDLARMVSEGSLAGWVTQRRVPKVILATQTKVIEVFVDDTGRFVPSLPLVSIFPREIEDLWRVGAALASPVSTAVALTQYAGTALSAHAIKISAKQSLRLPIPPDGPDADRAVSLFRNAHSATHRDVRQTLLLSFAEASISAFGVPAVDASVLLDWWTGRFLASQKRR